MSAKKKQFLKCTKGQLNLEENNFFAYVMKINFGNQNKTKKHACLRNNSPSFLVSHDEVTNHKTVDSL